MNTPYCQLFRRHSSETHQKGTHAFFSLRIRRTGSDGSYCPGVTGRYPARRLAGARHCRPSAEAHLRHHFCPSRSSILPAGSLATACLSGSRRSPPPGQPLRPLLTSRSNSSPSPLQAQGEIFPGKKALLHCTTTLATRASAAARSAAPPIRFLSIGSQLRSLRPAHETTYTSRSAPMLSHKKEAPRCGALYQ